MKLKIRGYEENVWILLINLICSNPDIFENPIVSDDPIPDKVGDIRIMSVKHGQTFEDMIDKEETETTIIEGCALVALNRYERFRLILNTDGSGVLFHLMHYIGRDLEVVLHKALLEIEM